MLLVVALIPLYLWKRSQDSQPHPHADEPVQGSRREAVVRPAGNRECVGDLLHLELALDSYACNCRRRCNSN
ncbi:DDRGK domain-containing protein [Arachis hypogaea]|nr:DDRGK domain-containing protein [Arachis hypogaea]